ncbi:hypothetical protein F5888DRAFT_1629839 [Russula emetica]|nr:hypothetical protein F5888DRAFT_1629839 [Russula emetica]
MPIGFPDTRQPERRHSTLTWTTLVLVLLVGSCLPTSYISVCSCLNRNRSPPPGSWGRTGGPWRRNSSGGLWLFAEAEIWIWTGYSHGSIRVSGTLYQTTDFSLGVDGLPEVDYQVSDCLDDEQRTFVLGIPKRVDRKLKLAMTPEVKCKSKRGNLNTFGGFMSSEQPREFRTERRGEGVLLTTLHYTPLSANGDEICDILLFDPETNARAREVISAPNHSGASLTGRSYNPTYCGVCRQNLRVVPL